ncbi:hypothetical protein ASPZODRAFT_14035 [Penicilliopsis zonata CBS 506.65]|uniref:Zn(2)-C6 fungal-type domain-containing protein n=1 Tax=Penicilliopsis zonata CBS 506.65 TaxID=1073090 RepID=A0A1L9SQ12_9EURO|nr:hypothetical protein ASPZODRAFT_14035 [Penicilliopsis zonata CBS 506.65]OJJ49315.1 hypothetical protein ASPZODRAFT_14035 [Penicilliopsis zonata CBS 506.65]
MPRRHLVKPCLQCRSRKVLCDRRPGRCANCERLHHRCSFETAADETQDRPPERRRGVRACVACQHNKERCSGESPDCRSCRQRGRLCRYPERRPARQSPPVSGGGSYRTIKQLAGRSLTLTRVDLLSLLDHYFLHLYPLPSYSFLHEASVRRMVATEAIIEPSLVLAMAAVAGLLCRSSPLAVDERTRCVEHAEQRLWAHLDTPSFFRLQALLLLVQYHAQVGNFARAFMMIAVVSRMAAALRLTYEQPDLDPIVQEMRRRALWTVVLLDGHFSAGLPGYDTIHLDAIYVQFPSTEEVFARGKASGNPTWPHPSLLALILSLSRTRRDIMRFTRQLVLVEEPWPQLHAVVGEFQNTLAQLQTDMTAAGSSRLPPPSERWFVRHLDIHLAWHHAHCDLYRLFLRGCADAAPEVVLDALEPSLVAHAHQTCDEHSAWMATALAGLSSSAAGSDRVLPLGAAVCAFQAARLVLFLPTFQAPGYHNRCRADEALRRAKSFLSFLQVSFGASAPTRDMVSHLERLVALYDVDNPSVDPDMPQSSSSSSSSSSNLATERHGRLAIHSLIHQAKFVDDSHLYQGYLNNDS